MSGRVPNVSVHMIEALKSDEIVQKVGGRFRLTALIQKRRLELINGARALIERRPDMTDMEVVIEEILQDKIAAEDVDEDEVE
ncbi:MAG: DNA-directed RNA polymerase subunit omega [Planctomycetota bacterium]